MFTVLPVKREQFLWLVVEGMPASHAYAKVYGEDKSVKVCEAAASRVLSDVKVIARRQELVQARHLRMPLTAEYLSRELMAVAAEARAKDQLAAASGALMGVAKLQGLLIERVAVDALVRKPSSSPDSPDEMSEAQWLAAYGAPALTIEHDPTIQPEHNQLTPADKSDEVVQPSEPEGS
jgi:hypothetical protein